jgi:dihydroneopterin aldolase
MTDAPDIIFIQDLYCNTIIGILPHEKKNPQRIRINIELSITKNNAAITDKISDCTVNYATVREHILLFAANHKYELIESFTENLINELLKKFHCHTITLEAAKLDVFEDTKACGIRITRNNNAI